MSVVVAVLVAPVILAFVNHMLGRSSRREQWRRDDEVAARVEAAAKAAQSAAWHVADDLAKADEQRAGLVAAVDAGRAVTESKLDLIHELVNSQMTARMMSELNAKEVALAALIGQRATLRRLIGDAEPADADAEAMAVLDASVAALEAEVAELRATTTDRLRKTPAADLHAVDDDGGNG